MTLDLKVQSLEMQEQFNFISAINETVDKAHKSIKKLRNIKAQLSKFVKEYSKKDINELIDKASMLEAKLSELKKNYIKLKIEVDKTH